MSRKKARDNAFKCVYQLGFDNYNSLESILNYSYEEEECADDEKEYMINVLNGVEKHIEEIDKIILEKLKNWTMQRISKVNLAILRLAIYEILYDDNIPVKVTANEAVELAKTYGDNDSKSFVNGVLAKVIENKEDV